MFLLKKTFLNKYLIKNIYTTKLDFTFCIRNIYFSNALGKISFEEDFNLKTKLKIKNKR